MEDHDVSHRGHPFPRVRPNVAIVESTVNIGPIDCPELRWWFAVPRLGDHTMAAHYEADTLELSLVTDMIATAPTRIHQVDCVETAVNEHITGMGSAATGWPTQFSPGFIYGALETDQARWIAVAKSIEGVRALSTFLDEGFANDWSGGNNLRSLYDDGRYRLESDGSYTLTDGTGLGSGVYDVTIGENTFRCLRVLDPDLSVPGGGELVETYVDQCGRTVLFRRYDGRFYRGVDLVQKYPNNPRIVINGCMFVHSNCTGRAHDVITNAGLGVRL